MSSPLNYGEIPARDLKQTPLGFSQRTPTPIRSCKMQGGVGKCSQLTISLGPASVILLTRDLIRLYLWRLIPSPSSRSKLKTNPKNKTKKPNTRKTKTMKKYTTTGCRAVSAESMSEAAEIFAARIARKKYGKSGYCRICNLESWSQDRSLGEYNAFIGYTPAHNQGQTVGNNTRFSVRLA